MKIIYGDFTLGLKGEDFHYIFSYTNGGPESIYAQKREWLYRCPRPTFWRALTDNDRGNGFHKESGIWLAADVYIVVKDISLEVDGEEIENFRAPGNNVFSDEEYAKNVKFKVVFETVTNPRTNVEVVYEVSEDGRINVNTLYEGKEGLPQLPVFGMRFIMPTKATRYKYEGLSGETYPDRIEGGIEGIYEIDGLPVTPYLVPQDCGMHMNTKWLEIYRNSSLDNRKRKEEESAITFFVDEKNKKENFAFSCLPYTAQELESATHMEELPLERRTVLCIYGAVRGLGGIDSWGAKPEEIYQISGQKDIELSFSIKF